MKCIAPQKTPGTTKRWNIFSKKTLRSLYDSPQHVEYMEIQSQFTYIKWVP